MANSESLENRDEQDKRLVEIFVFLGVVALYLLIGYVLWRILNNYIQPGDDPAQRRGLVQALGLILVGLAGAIGIYFTWRGQQHAREAQKDNQENTRAQLEMTRDQLTHAIQAQKDNQENTQKELNLTRQGQMTERFTQAIEQLGSEKLEIKLGGIYSLERTAHEEQNYHWPIMEALTTYVRLHAQLKQGELSGGDHVPPLKPDIQAILTVIGRRSAYHRTDKEVEYGAIHLNETNLKRANLEGAYLAGAWIVWANLEEANLQSATLWEVNLNATNFRDARLQKADLRGAYLGEADLRGANLEGANLQDAFLDRANFEGAIIRGANLLGSNITDEQLEQAED